MDPEASEAAAAEVEQTETAEPSSEAVAESETAEKPEKQDKPKHDPIQRRIDKLTREKYQARAELDVLRKQIEELKAPKQQAAPEGEPRLEDFDNIVEWQRAHGRWMYDSLSQQERAKRDAETAQQRRAETQGRIAESWQKRIGDAVKEMPDFREVIEAAAVPMTEEIALAIMESDRGPQLAYYLALNPEEAESLAEMSPAAANRFLGRLEAKLEAEAVAKRKSDAPKPPTPIKGVSAGADKDPDKMSADEWMRWRSKQLARKTG